MEQHLAALILAAGRSTRMRGGTAKQLLPLGGRPVLRRCCETLVAAGVVDIVVVVAPGAGAAAALAGLPVRVAVNPMPRSEMADSARAGLSAIRAGATGVLVCLADHPLVSAETVRALAAVHGRRPGAIVVPVSGGRRGHPALFPVALLSALGAGRTLRDLREAHGELVHECAVADSGVLFDMDTWEDYEEARARLASDAGGSR